MKKYDKSVFERYLKRDKELAKSYRNLAYAQKQLGNNKQAIENFRKALQIWPSFSKAKRELEELEKIISS